MRISQNTPFASFFSAFLFSLLSTLHVLSFGQKRFDVVIGKHSKGDLDQLQVYWPV